MVRRDVRSRLNGWDHEGLAGVGRVAPLPVDAKRPS